MSQNLYWTDGSQGSIWVQNLERNFRKEILTGLQNPRAIFWDYLERYAISLYRNVHTHLTNFLIRYYYSNRGWVKYVFVFVFKYIDLVYLYLYLYLYLYTDLMYLMNLKPSDLSAIDSNTSVVITTYYCTIV